MIDIVGFDSFTITYIDKMTKMIGLSIFVATLIALNLSTRKNFLTNNISKQEANESLVKFNEFIKTMHIMSKANIDPDNFIPLSYFEIETDKSICKGCNQKLLHDKSFCLKCGYDDRIKLSHAWSDVTRVHSIPIYRYDRSTQFRDYILQYQGKIKIPHWQEFKDLLATIKNPIMCKIDFFNFLNIQFKSHPIIKTYPMRLLNQVVHPLYNEYKKRQAPDLYNIERSLLKDFNKFTKEFSKRKKSRFVSNQYLLFQLLNKYGVDTTYDDVLLSSKLNLVVTKTITSDIFSSLGWIIKDGE